MVSSEISRELTTEFEIVNQHVFNFRGIIISILTEGTLLKMDCY